MNHPLTDEMIENIAPDAQWAGDIGDVVFRHSDIRTAADWQLEQVIKWLRENLYWEEEEDGSVRYVYGNGFASICTVEHCSDFTEVIADLKDAMRPQEGS